jgi:hypothetical protein
MMMEEIPDDAFQEQQEEHEITERENSVIEDEQLSSDEEQKQDIDKQKHEQEEHQEINEKEEDLPIHISKSSPQQSGIHKRNKKQHHKK